MQLLDYGSEASFVTSEFCNLPRRDIPTTVLRINKRESVIEYQTEFLLKFCIGTFQKNG